MKKIYISLFYLVLIVGYGRQSFAQMVGVQTFLKGQFLEVGVAANGAFGACNPAPAGYHAHPVGSQLASVYDWGHDGWGVGVPTTHMGDYTVPGTPFEGWEIEVNGVRSQAMQGAVPTGYGVACTPVYGPGALLTGGPTGYTNTAGDKRALWAGSAGGLSITRETRVDTFASWVVVTAVITNTTAATVNNVYYLRSCDPDNTVTWPSGLFNTTNTILHQNEDTRHRVFVNSVGPAPTYTAINSSMILGTKDCRAKCFSYSSWPIQPTVPLGPVWTSGAGIGTVAMTLGSSHVNMDWGYGLVYNLGNFAPGASTSICYTYIYNGNLGIDSALPDPRLKITAGIVTTVYPLVAAPNPESDTFDVCPYAGLTSLPVDILYGDEKCWLTSKWTWSPGTGLSATTGAHVIINPTLLPPVITYTIVGTDTAKCLSKTFYLTIHTCNGAEANSPCVGDTLWLNAPGDSTAASYQWYGPAPSTSVFATTQKTFIFPTTAAHNGTYSVIKTVGGMPDTSEVIVTLRHKPTVWASSNSPLCLGAANTLLLTSVSDSPSVTYSWSKIPPFFSSGLQNPSISSFSIADTGIYRVVISSVFGCKDTDEVHVTMVPPPGPPHVTVVTPYCQNDVFVPFSVSGLVPGGSVLWYTGPVGGVGSATAPTVNTAVPGLYKFYFSQIVGSCEGIRDSVKVLVNPIPAPILGPAELCQYFNITMTNPTPGGVWSSSNPSIATIGAGTGIIYGATAGTVQISYTLPTTCRRVVPVTVHPKPAPPTFEPHRECQYVLGHIASATGTNLTWYGLGVTPGSPIAPTPNTDVPPGIYTYYVTQTSAFGCVSDSATYPVRVYPEPLPPVVVDTTYCQHDSTKAVALTAVGSNLQWYISATSTPGSTIAPIPSTLTPGTTTYYVTQKVDGCESPRVGLNVTILYLPDFKITPDRPWVCQFDSLGFHYRGPNLVDPAYTWTLPVGASFVGGTTPSDTTILVKFDTSWGQHIVTLTASNYKGRCAATRTANIKVVYAPTTHMYIKPDVCLGDTINLALSDRSSNAYKYTWTIDGVPMASSAIIDLISANSNSGGPFVISWHDSGRHILNIQGFTVEGCKSAVTADTINVHVNPNAMFDYVTKRKDSLCLEDSVLFRAVRKDYSCTYRWEPEHSFTNDNRPEIWGKIEQLKGMISLTVTDPYGCRTTFTKQLNPEPCCTVVFPNAFTPNGDGKNDYFRPITSGFHRFHILRVSNRWGQTLFESTNSNPQWDGIYNGVVQDLGVYFYYLKYDCGGKTMEVKGDFTLIH